MVSLRAATDKTHITQLLGRMVRTPLARRIPGNERLNAVDCLLPRFNQTSVEAVVKALMTGGEGEGELEGRRILVKPQDMKPNPEIDESVWEKLLSLPSQALPKRQASPVKRLTALAHELAGDKLLPDAGKKAHSEMHNVLDSTKVRYKDEILKARGDVLTVEGKTVRADVGTKDMTFNEFVEAADYIVIEDAFKRAGRMISPDLARTYAEHLADSEVSEEDPEEMLIEAHTDIAAMGLVPEIKGYLEDEATKLSGTWLTEHRVTIKSLSDERQEVYRLIREMSTEPVEVDLARPNTWLQPTVAIVDGSEVELPRYEKHMLCDSEGKFPDNFNEWETHVLSTELGRSDTLAWYRNPSRPSQDSLGINYQEGTDHKIVRPDFIVFSANEDGSVMADIVDPHGLHFGDALPKLKGLSAYAEEYGSHYRRIDAIADIDGTFRVLDLTEPTVRQEVIKATDAKSLYLSSVSTEYTD